MSDPQKLDVQKLDGRSLSKQLKASIKAEVESLTAQQNQTPKMAILRIGDDGASAGYARAIEKNCASVGVDFQAAVLPTEATQEEAEGVLRSLSEDPQINGIMVLEPLPKQIDDDKLMVHLSPAKDVDGVHPTNAGRLAAQRSPYFAPATPSGGIRLLEEAGIDFQGKHAVVVGRSDIVGKPMAMLLLHRHCTVTIAHSRTQDLPAVCREADILCVAVGRPHMVTGEWIKPGAVVVDFGTSYTDDGLKGDVEPESANTVAGLITPVPGGTGPMTNAILMTNLLAAAKAQWGLG
ncbi:MAG: bifunctional 5,10-methylenetetrahydrofolate dehydrogenase/5,10-methenyltetrahydrofolate cyclohydrolase [Chloroflexota bacterium]